MLSGGFSSPDCSSPGTSPDFHRKLRSSSHRVHRGVSHSVTSRTSPTDTLQRKDGYNDDFVLYLHPIHVGRRCARSRPASVGVEIRAVRSARGGPAFDGPGGPIQSRGGGASYRLTRSFARKFRRVVTDLSSLSAAPLISWRPTRRQTPRAARSRLRSPG